jgi:DNA-3-methyladenine glycosylase II
MVSQRFILPVASPFRLDFTIWVLRRRKKNAIDHWVGGEYTRVLAFNDNPVKLTLTQEGSMDDPKLVAVLQSRKRITLRLQEDVQLGIQRMLGLNVNLQPFYMIANNNDVLAPLVREFMGVKPPCLPNIFEALVNAIACQQITLDLGILLLNRLSENFGLEFDDGEVVRHAFPRPADLANTSEEHIKKLGFSYQKARAIRELAVSIESNKIDLTNLDQMSNQEAVEHLSTIRGIGRWSAEYVLLRGLGRVNIFPGDDIGAQNNLKRLFHLDKKPDYEETKKLTSQWHPYEGLVYFHFLLNRLHIGGVI